MLSRSIQRSQSKGDSDAFVAARNKAKADNDSAQSKPRQAKKDSISDIVKQLDTVTKQLDDAIKQRKEAGDKNIGADVDIIRMLKLKKDLTESLLGKNMRKLADTSDELTRAKRRLSDLDDEKLEVDPIQFPYAAYFPSSDFHKYCKDISLITEKIEIKCTNNKVSFGIKGADICDADFEISETNGGLSIDINTDNKNEIVQGVFSLKWLNVFTKCTNLSPQVVLYLKNDYPLIIKYSVAALGEVKFVLSQKDTKN
jgi:hypothetical protein